MEDLYDELEIVMPALSEINERSANVTEFVISCPKSTSGQLVCHWSED